jgi:TRAP transporter 4TM/12TM fusion protein
MADARGTDAVEAPVVVQSADDLEHGLPPGFGPGWTGRLLFWIAIVFSSFQIATALYAIIPSQVLRAMHVGFLVLVSSALLANHRSSNPLGKLTGWLIGLVGFAAGLYQWVFYTDLVNRAGDLTTGDIVAGLAALITLFYISWRLMGAALPLICLAFVAYALFGDYLPAPLDHRPFDALQVLEQMGFGTEGIYGTPTFVSATYIFLFVLFGVFLERAGMIQLFNDVALGLFGHAKGGPAKVSVFSSALMGTISGSGVANVVTVGQFTIPLMKRFGYSPSFAGGVEATASMGGQIMPPVMGAVAFIMAENIGVPYSEIVKAAIIPAFLYFASTFWMVHLEAGKHGLTGMRRQDLPSPLGALKRNWHLIIPLAVLVYLLMGGYTPLFAGAVGLSLTAVMILGASAAQPLSPLALRVLFWIALGLAAASFLEFGVIVLVAVVAVLVGLNLLYRGGRQTLAMCRDGLAEGARQALPVGLACAIVGTVVGSMTLTGTGSIFGNYIVAFGRDNLFFCLLLVMVTSIILGTGLPTIPTYIITASIAAPALLQLGVPLIVSHMFVFYYGIIADLTPPVALAALAAAPIAKASPDAIGWQATRVAIAGFVIPFMGVYAPTLMLQDGGAIAAAYGYWAEVIIVFLKCSLAIMMLGVAAIGYLFTRTTLMLQIAAGFAAGFLAVEIPWSDPIGLALSAIVIVAQWLRYRSASKPTRAASRA